MINKTHIANVSFVTNQENSDLVWAQETKAFWSHEPIGTLILFVHGWSGGAMTTWEEFTDLRPDNWNGCDLIFFGYESREPQAQTNADFLRFFLKDFFSNPSEMINETISHLTETCPKLKRSSEFQYTQVIIVAHSLGAVISRRALLDSYLELEDSLKKSKNSWLFRTKLILFAPAHNGSPWAEDLKKFGGSFVAALVNGISLYKAFSIRNLHPNSPTLKNLRDDTEIVLNDGYTEPFKASLVIFPEYEWVVYNDRFSKDPVNEKPLVGRNHMNVCKPTEDWQTPIELVKKGLA